MSVAAGPAMTLRHRLLLRAGLLLLALAQGVVAVWALVAPRAFFDGFPLAGHAWVALLPPYNEHLVRDVGALSLAITVLLALAAVRAEVLLVRAVLVAFLAYAVPHALFHGMHLDGFGTVDAVAQTSGLLLQIALAAVLLVLAAPTSPRPPS